MGIWCATHMARADPEEEEMPELLLNKRPVTMQDFEDKLREWKAKPTDISGLPSVLADQFTELRQLSPDHSKRAALLDENKSKNRYCNVLPFDHSRVKLTQLDDDITSDYINANYIQGYHSKREYIATQGPLQSTVDDFWRMVWEQRSPVIVMLSGLTEGRLNKVFKYYLDEDEMHVPCHFDLVTVTLKAVTRHAGYLVRTFKLAVGQSSRTVQQLYVENWKDFDANLNANLVLEFVRAVHHAVPPDNKRPLVVHCSAGIGRTGTWIAIDYFMHYVRDNPLTAPIDIFHFVLTMRDCRVNMVQAAEQYVFIHDVVREMVRRKTEVDRYDEPVYANQSAFSNSGFDDDASVSSRVAGRAASCPVSEVDRRQPSSPSSSIARTSSKSSGSSTASGSVRRNQKTETSRM
ncbi:hypothetical protein V1264_016543 [Littorina saxatilis]|uniref:protein-tyrosine-phosphatase n=1 Tax=Littorina saxatilis TaxID=31220 RepID=A0AAN9GI39_9CAEN